MLELFSRSSSPIPIVRLPCGKSRLLPSSRIVPVPLKTLPTARLRSRAGPLFSSRSRAPDWISNCPATVKVERTVKLTKALLLSSNLPPAGTLTGRRTTDSAALKQALSWNISQRPRFSSRPSPCRAKVLQALTQRSRSRLARGRLSVREADELMVN